MRAALYDPRGCYVSSVDSIIKASVTPFGLNMRSLGRIGAEYLDLVHEFRSAFPQKVIFQETYPFEAEQRLLEIHTHCYAARLLRPA